MPTVTVKAELTVKDLIDGVSQLTPGERHEFMLRVDELLMNQLMRCDQPEETWPVLNSDVNLIPPRQDKESQAQARVLADVVRTELADLESETTFDEFMASRRGRTWLP
jgi:hypothetical protein